MINAEPCCYGFFNELEEDVAEGSWESACQRPFRGHWLWLWGAPDALVTGLQIGGSEQLLLDGMTPRGLPFGAMRRNVSVSKRQFLGFVEGKWLPGGPTLLEGARVNPVVASSFGAPHLMLETSHVGARLRFTFSGHVLGIVLVGEQASDRKIPEPLRNPIADALRAEPRCPACGFNDPECRCSFGSTANRRRVAAALGQCSICFNPQSRCTCVENGYR